MRVKKNMAFRTVFLFLTLGALPALGGQLTWTLQNVSINVQDFYGASGYLYTVFGNGGAVSGSFTYDPDWVFRSGEQQSDVGPVVGQANLSTALGSYFGDLDIGFTANEFVAERAVGITYHGDPAYEVTLLHIFVGQRQPDLGYHNAVGGNLLEAGGTYSVRIQENTSTNCSSPRLRTCGLGVRIAGGTGQLVSGSDSGSAAPRSRAPCPCSYWVSARYLRDCGKADSTSCRADVVESVLCPRPQMPSNWSRC